MKGSKNEHRLTKISDFFKTTLGTNILISISIVVVIFVCWPIILKIYNFIIRWKVSSSVSYVNRLEFLKLVISLVGPILTILVFYNTLRIQKEQQTDKKYDRTFTEFYKLLDIYAETKKDAMNDVERILADIEQEYIKCSIIPSAHSLEKNSNYNLCQLINISDNILKKNSKSIGYYFRVVYGILKTLNQHLKNKDIDYEEYNSFIRIFRMQITTSEFILIDLNSSFAHTGFGLGVQIIGSGFLDGVDILKDYNNLIYSINYKLMAKMHSCEEQYIPLGTYMDIRDLFSFSETASEKRNYYENTYESNKSLYEYLNNKNK